MRISVYSRAPTHVRVDHCCMLCIRFSDWNSNQLQSAAAFGHVHGVLAALDEGAYRDTKDNVRNPIVRLGGIAAHLILVSLCSTVRMRVGLRHDFEYEFVSVVTLSTYRSLIELIISHVYDYAVLKYCQSERSKGTRL